jgi:hypothetical protein
MEEFLKFRAEDQMDDDSGQGLRHEIRSIQIR